MRELALDFAKIVPNRLEQQRESGGRGFLRGGIQAGQIRPYTRAECQRNEPANPCGVLQLRHEETCEIVKRGADDRVGVDAAQLGDRLGDARDVRRLVSFPPVWNRSEEGAVRLDEQTVERYHARHLLQLECSR